MMLTHDHPGPLTFRSTIKSNNIDGVKASSITRNTANRASRNPTATGPLVYVGEGIGNNKPHEGHDIRL